VVDDMPGRWIIVAAWASNAAFAASATPAAIGIDAAQPVAAVVAVALFFVALAVWAIAFALAVARTTRGDDIVVANLFFLLGSAPRAVRHRLYAALGVSLGLVVLTAWNAPFGVLVPMLPLGLMGLWSARHGRFPPRARRTDA
jgi:hypothetical protein